MDQRALDRIKISGYKSIDSCDLRLEPLNVLVGPNGAGKSNLVSALGLLGSIVNEELQFAAASAGGASALLRNGPQVTQEFSLHTYFGMNQYEAVLSYASNDELFFSRETVYYHQPQYQRPWSQVIGRGHRESNLRASRHESKVADYCYEAMRSWRVFHFHDTSRTAPPKQTHDLHDDRELKPDGANIAPFLHRLRDSHPLHYRRIVDSVRLVAPFLRDFVLEPSARNEDRIRLEWLQEGASGTFGADSLSDGSLRFILLSTLLLQPDPPSVVVVDEPELGLHPFAITQLADLFRSTAAAGPQVIISTQSVTLLNQLDLENVIIVEQQDGESVFEPLDRDSVTDWLDEYAVGELWEKNLLGGRPG